LGPIADVWPRSGQPWKQEEPAHCSVEAGTPRDFFGAREKTSMRSALVMSAMSSDLEELACALSSQTEQIKNKRTFLKRIPIFLCKTFASILFCPLVAVNALVLLAKVGGA
jgi:hypothetical protein